jgi:hypothetical protein
MSRALKSVIFIVVTILSTAVLARPSPSHNSCAHGDFCSSASHARDLLQVLEKGVDQCFNQNQAKARQTTQSRLVSLDEKIHAATSDWAGKDKKKVAGDAAILTNELHQFDASPGFPADIYCKTNRKCLEAGFEGNKRYPHCLPVGNDIHQNVQYLSLEELLNSTLPKLVALLKSRAASSFVAQSSQRNSSPLE